MQQAAQAYGQVARKALSPRDLEAQLLIKAAAKLQAARDDFDAKDNAAYEALTYNRKLWTVLSTSATSRDNPLPTEIKNNIASLGVFIMSQTMSAITDPDASKLTVLITINRELAAGLRARANVPAAADDAEMAKSVNSSI